MNPLPCVAGRLALLAILAANCVLASPAAARSSSSAPCAVRPGFAELHAELQQAVRSRDGEALRALFHSSGRMRVNGIGGDASYSDWRLSRPSAEAMWADLGRILKLGCIGAGDRLLIPALAIHARHGVSTEAVVTLAPLSLRVGPSTSGAIVRSVPKGRLLILSIEQVRPGWSELLVQGRRLYAPSALLRSPFATQIELARENGRWRIISLGSGI